MTEIFIQEVSDFLFLYKGIFILFLSDVKRKKTFDRIIVYAMYSVKHRI